MIKGGLLGIVDKKFILLIMIMMEFKKIFWVLYKEFMLLGIIIFVLVIFVV